LKGKGETFTLTGILITNGWQNPHPDSIRFAIAVETLSQLTEIGSNSAAQYFLYKV
jgi:hypothetical protein